MQLEKVSFREACEILADKVNFKIPDISEGERTDKNRVQRLKDCVRSAAVLYYSNLYSVQGKNHLAYILGRGISMETLKEFAVGASLDAISLPKYLFSKGYTEDEMLECQLVSKKDNGHLSDAMYGRLVIPIFNVFGEIIAFGGRVLEQKVDFAKYKNTSDSALFKKGNTVFGLNKVKVNKQKENFDFLIIVEGYMDVINLYDKGIKNVVAGMGTALTEMQAKSIKRYTDKIYCCYDGDGAGQKATQRNLEILYKSGLDVYIVTIPDGMDPDDYVKKYGKEGFNALLLAAMPIFEYIIGSIASKYDLSTPTGKSKFASEAIGKLSIIENDIERQPFLELISKYSSIDYRLLEGKTAPIQQEEKINLPQTDKTSDFVLYSLLTDKPYAKKDYDYESLFFGENLELYKKYKEELAADVYKPDEIYNSLSPELKNAYARVMSFETLTDESKKKEEYSTCLHKLEKASLSRRKDELTAKYSQETDKDKKIEIMKELQQVIAKLNLKK